MNKSMIARLSFVAIGLAALVAFALQARGTENETAQIRAERVLTETSSAVTTDADAESGEDAFNAETAADLKSATKEPKPARVADEVLGTTETSTDSDADAETQDAADGESEAGEPDATEPAQSDEDEERDPNTVTMTLLHNNDGESKLLADAEGGFPGVARFANTWVELGRSTDADILLRVSAGDNFLASKEFSAGLERDGDEPLFDSLALRGLYEAIALGNHDFDFGPDVTARFIDGIHVSTESNHVPFVSANIDVSGEPALQELAADGRLVPSTVYTDPTSGMTVGVIGAVTPQLPNISSPRNVVVDADVAGRVNAQAQQLIDEGVNRIVLVSHLQGLGEDEALVPQLRNIDIVVAGGGDELLKNEGDSCQPAEDPAGPYPLLITDADGRDVPVVTAPGGYRCIGRLDVTFDTDGEIIDWTGSSIGVTLDGPQEQFALAQVEEPLSAALTDLQASVIGVSDVTLDGQRSSVRTGPSNVGELLADALLAAGQDAPLHGGTEAIVAVQNGGGIRNDAEIAAGDITQADTFDIAPFANFVVVGSVPREQFKAMLEVGVSGLPEAQGTFPQIAGFTMDVDPAQPARVVDRDGDCSLTGDEGSRIQNVTLLDGTEIVRNGQVVPGDDVSLATIDFLAGGGDCYPLTATDFVKVGTSYQQALSDFIADELDGQVSASAYPAGGDRISFGAADEVEGVTELAETGLDTSLFIVLSLTVLTAGALVYVEARRAGWLSLTNRLHATRAWYPRHDDDSADSDRPSQLS